MSESKRDHGNAAAYVFAALIFTIPWESMVTLPPFGGIGRIVGYLAMGIGAVLILLTGHWRRPAGLFVWLAALVLYMVISLSWIEGLNVMSTGIVRLTTYVRLLVMAFMLYFLADTPRVRNHFLLAYLLGDVLLIVLTAYSYGSSRVVMSDRIFAPGVNPNGMAFQLAMGIPMAAYLARQAQGAFARLLLWSYVPVGFFFVALTASRGGLIAGGVALMYLPLMAQRQGLGRRILLFAGLALAIAVGYRMLPEANVERLATIERELSAEGSIGQRRGIWRAGWEAFQARPWLGHGVGQFQTVAPRLGSKSGSPHNAFLSFLVEVGVLGSALLAILLASLLWGVFRMGFDERNLCLIMLLVWMTHSLAADTSYGKATWFLFGLVPAFLPERRSPVEVA